MPKPVVPDMESLQARLDKLKEDLPVPPAAATKRSTAPSLPSLPKAQLHPDDEDSSDKEMENWCCICNDDAIVRCIDCDDDPYCKACFREGHPRSDPEMGRHRTTAVQRQRR